MEQTGHQVPPSHRSSSIQTSSNRGQVLEVEEHTLGDFIVQNIEGIISATTIESSEKITLMSYYIGVKHADFSQTALVADIDEAIKKQRLVLELTGKAEEVFPERLDLLSSLLKRKYERLGRSEDIVEAIEKAEEAVRLTPSDHPALPGRLNNLGNKLHSRYERTGQMNDLKMAIERAEEAVRLTPSGHPGLPAMLNNLGNKLESQYERTGQMIDLEMAIEKAEEAVRLTHPNHPDLPKPLNNLSNKLQRRYERTEQMADLDMAIEKAEEAVRLTPPNHPGLPRRLNNLGSMLERQYKRTGQMADLDRAIEKSEEALRLTPPDHPALPAILNNLGNKLQSRYERTGQIADLEMAIEKAEEVVRLTPPDHPNLPRWLYNLGRKYLLVPGNLQIDNALQSFFRSWQSHSGIPSDRLGSAVAAVDLLATKKSWKQAADLAVEACHILPLMNRRMLTRDDQEHILSMFTGLAAKATSLLLESNRSVEEAVEVSEQGRGAILGLMIDDRREISHLHRLCPKEAEDYKRLRDEIDGIPNDFVNNEATRDMRDQMLKHRAQAIKELEQCIERIRAVPGLERYLLGSSVQEIQQQAHAGPIIFVNVTDIRSDALIIELQQIRSVCLPAFSADALRSWQHHELTKFSSNTFGKKNKTYRKFLSWIWISCVQTIIDSLSHNSTVRPCSQPSRRVWWIGVGEACDVPFHAAGDHSPGSTNNTASHVVSSYTPTIKALEFARERLAQARQYMSVNTMNHRSPKLLMITMPHTPGASDLLGVTTELTSIQTAVASTYSITHLLAPASFDVKEQLKSCNIFHFAGHGTADPVNPSQGCLILQKPDESGATLLPDPLSVSDISQLHLPYAQLAYLSACSTAENISTTLLADEVIHLVSGFQVAGFAHVVGSMWPSVDQICADVARLFYQRLCQVNPQSNIEDGVASALHSALFQIRHQYWMEPLAWAQYVHFGA